MSKIIQAMCPLCDNLYSTRADMWTCNTCQYQIIYRGETLEGANQTISAIADLKYKKEEMDDKITLHQLHIMMRNLFKNTEQIRTFAQETLNTSTKSFDVIDRHFKNERLNRKLQEIKISLKDAFEEFERKNEDEIIY